MGAKGLRAHEAMSIETVDLFHKQYGDGPPFLILHGLLGASGNWHSLSRNVFAEDFSVYALDLRNHGRSPHAERLDYPSMAADVERFFQIHALREAYLMGHSMGGKVAMQLALSDPGLIKKLIVVDVAPRAYPPYHREILDALQSIAPSSVSSRDDVEEALTERISSKPVRQFLLKNLAYDSDDDRYYWQMGLDAIAENYENVNQAIESDRRYDGPTLFVRGENSSYIDDEEDMDEIRRLFPKARLETIAGAGHWIHADKPDAFAEVVLDFLFE